MQEKEENKTMGPEVGIEIISGIKDALSGKGITLFTDKVSAVIHNCLPTSNCEWKEKDVIWSVESGYMYMSPFRNWKVAKLDIYISFEHNGCDVNNARLRLSTKNYISWYNDRTTLSVKATGNVSKISGASGCPKCCTKSTCVIFDVQIDTAWDFVRVKGESWQVRICGDGNVDIKPLP